MLLFQMYTLVQFHIASKCTDLSTYQVRQKPVHAKKTLFWSQNCLTHGNNSVLMNLFSIEIVYLFQEVTVGVVKLIFCYKEGILMETDPFPAILCRVLNILL